jgi:Ni2+-binding GTPase involved in maturation of urease and hydrogenase
VQGALEEEEWDLKQLDFLFIENVVNLVCPSSYDLGEDLRLVLISGDRGRRQTAQVSDHFPHG